MSCQMEGWLVNGEFDEIWKEAAVAWWRYSRSICMEGLRKSKKLQFRPRFEPHTALPPNSLFGTHCTAECVAEVHASTYRFRCRADMYRYFNEGNLSCANNNITKLKISILSICYYLKSRYTYKRQAPKITTFKNTAKTSITWHLFTFYLKYVFSK